MNKYREVCSPVYAHCSGVTPAGQLRLPPRSGKKDYIVVYHAGIDPDLASQN